MKIQMLSKVMQLIACTLFLTGNLFAQANSNVPNPKQITKSLLWKIEGNDIQPSYLYGTIHIIDEKDFFLPETTTNALKASDQVVFEIDMDDPQLQANMMAHTAMKKEMTIDKLLSETDYKILDQAMTKQAGVGIAAFNNWQPMLLASFFFPTLVEKSASYEMSLTQLALTEKKEILGFETIEEQINAVGTIPYVDQAKYLMEMINDPEKSKIQFAEMVSVYKSQDVEALFTLLMEQSKKEGIDFNTDLIKKRNHNWIPKIGKFAKEKSCFFAVGGGHLGGEHGVLQLLTKAGYTVIPVKNK